MYRNQKRIDAAFGLNGLLRENNGDLKDLIDDRLRSDIGGFPGAATKLGVWIGAGSAFYSPSRWIQPLPGVSVYGDDPSAVLPGDFLGAF